MGKSAYEYQQLLNNSPILRRFLNLIGWAEGADYNVGFGNRPINNLNWHPYQSRQFRIGNSTTSAAGKYQFQRGTWEDVARQLGLPDFSPRSQDIAAVALIDRRGALNDVLNGNIATAVTTLQPEWQSFITRPLNAIIQKFGGTRDVIPQTQAQGFSQYQGIEVIGAKNRYLIAFAILVIIFIFAFN